MQKVKAEFVILTDANVFFEKDMLYQLVKHFKNEKIGVVGANIINIGLKEDGISKQESTYVQQETKLKYHEGKTFGLMMGAFGACYALRKKWFKPVKHNFLMEDFFITMNVLLQKGKAIIALDAKAYEDVSNETSEEFRRKKRISTGNYQNFFYFFGKIFQSDIKLLFVFISHKLLRWVTPFLLIIVYLANLVLIYDFRCTIYDFRVLYSLLFIVQNCLISLIFVDLLLKRVGVHFYPIRLVNHFYMMNVALMMGFFKYLKGVKTSAWTPIKRDQ